VLVLVSWKLARLPRLLERLSGETLVLYVVHLQLLYPPIVGLVIFAAIVALLGFGAGLVVRSTPAAVAFLILWPLLIENLITVVFALLEWEGANKWLPYSAGINLGNPDEITILDIAKEILTIISESKSTITFQPMPPDDPKLRRPDITRAKQILGWTPKVSRREGLKKMIDFYRDVLSK
jgi:hypothetical protein